jgi:hypothetical protein
VFCVTTTILCPKSFSLRLPVFPNVFASGESIKFQSYECDKTSYSTSIF